MILITPTPGPGPNQSFLNQLATNLRTAFLRVVSTDEAVSRIMLSAPNGTVYQVTVDNAGTLHTTINDGKSRI